MPRTVVLIFDLLLAADVEPEDGSRVIARSCLALAVAPTILHPRGAFEPLILAGNTRVDT